MYIKEASSPMWRFLVFNTQHDSGHTCYLFKFASHLEDNLTWSSWSLDFRAPVLQEFLPKPLAMCDICSVCQFLKFVIIMTSVLILSKYSLLNIILYLQFCIFLEASPPNCVSFWITQKIDPPLFAPFCTYLFSFSPTVTLRMGLLFWKQEN